MSERSASVPSRYWISRPWVDLLIGCGGLSLPLLATSYVMTPGSSRAWAGLFYSLALAANYPHYMATIYRAYGAADRKSHRAYTIYGTAVLVLLGVLAHIDLRWLTLLFSAYVMWSPWHYSGQNYGLLVMFLRRAGADVSSLDRRGLRLAFFASYVMLLATFHEGPSRDPLVLSLGLQPAVTRVIGGVGGALFALLGLGVLVRIARGQPGTRLLAPAMLYATQALWFVVPIIVAWATGAAAPQARYSSGVLALMHAAQYLWITQYFARREQGRAWAGSRYWAAVVLGGIALFLPVPWLASYTTAVDFTASMLVVTAVVNLHHFMIDGVVWKLRDPRVGRTLTSETVAGTPGRSGGHRRRSWRLGLAAGAVMLLALAGVDQWRYWLSLRESDPAALATAARLNPYDRLVQGRLLRALTDRGDFEGARRHLDEIVTLAPRNVDARVNAGVLARRTNRPADARRHWQAALDEEPSNAMVHLYLAELFDELGQVRDASGHYRRYLELIVERGAGSAEPAAVAAVVIKFGDALARLGEMTAARTQFELARNIAARAGALAIEREAVRRLSP